MFKLCVIVPSVTSIGKRANSLNLGDGGAVGGAHRSRNTAAVKVAGYQLLFTFLTDCEVDGWEVRAVAESPAITVTGAAYLPPLCQMVRLNGSRGSSPPFL